MNTKTPTPEVRKRTGASRRAPRSSRKARSNRGLQVSGLYHHVFGNIQLGLYIFQLQDISDDRTFRVVAANQASELITGVPRTDILGKTVDECFPELRNRGILKQYLEVIKSGKGIDYENIVYGDHRIPLANYSARFFSLPEQCLGVAFEDISVRFLAEKKLRRIETRFETLASMLPVGIYQNDSDGNCVYVNEKCCLLCGVERKDLLEKNWAKCLFPGDRRRIVAKWQNAVRKKVPFQAEYRFQHPKGAIVWVLGQAVPEYDESGNCVGFIGSITDITERKRLENEILSVSTQEQQRIGQAIHDRLGQHLTGIAFLAKALAQTLNAENFKDATAAEEIASLINQAILSTRDLARMLHPVELEENGLNAAFQELVSNASKMFNIRCAFHCEQPPPVNDFSVATHLYHIAQEAITNAVKHGGATAVTVKLGRENGKAVLRVEDNGKGIGEGYQTGKGLGLRIMKHRAARIDGDLQIVPSPSGGTLLTCAFTVHELEPAGDTA